MPYYLPSTTGHEGWQRKGTSIRPGFVTTESLLET